MSRVYEPCTTQLPNDMQCGLNRDHQGDCSQPLAEVVETMRELRERQPTKQESLTRALNVTLAGIEEAYERGLRRGAAQLAEVEAERDSMKELTKKYQEAYVDLAADNVRLRAEIVQYKLWAAFRAHAEEGHPGEWADCRTEQCVFNRRALSHTGEEPRDTECSECKGIGMVVADCPLPREHDRHQRHWTQCSACQPAEGSTE